MGYTKFTAPVVRAARNFKPMLSNTKASGICPNKSLIERLKLEKCQRYDIYIDTERQLLGIDVTPTGQYVAAFCGSKKYVRFRMAAVHAGLAAAGVDCKQVWTLDASFINLPAPLLAEFRWGHLPKKSQAVSSK